jgi:hypothetical protein
VVTWPNALYWLSIVPVVPFVTAIVERFCCGDFWETLGRYLQAYKPRETGRLDLDVNPLTVLAQFVSAGGNVAWRNR